MPRTNEEIARIHWNMIVADEVTFQGRTMTKDKFIHKASSSPEEYVVPQVISPWLQLMDIVSTGVTSSAHKAWNTDGSDVIVRTVPLK